MTSGVYAHTTFVTLQQQGNSKEQTASSTKNLDFMLNLEEEEHGKK